MLKKMLGRFSKKQDSKQAAQTLQLMSSLNQNNALQSRSEIEAATQIVEWLDLPSHHDPQKNWDSLKSLYYILQYTNPKARVLDAGAINSPTLKWLHKLGYQQLYACDVRSSRLANLKRRYINFSIQDITATNYPDHYFGAVTCISVIEHGVDLNAYLREMSRLIQPGGVLTTSTDYWSEPVDCTGIYPYGQEMGEMKVFQPQELEHFVDLAQKYGFKLPVPLNLATKERAIRWERVDREYTFAFIALTKTEI